ncbi:MAG: TlpA family protein disulfide reductase [Endomicrobiales bacterium]
MFLKKHLAAGLVVLSVAIWLGASAARAETVAPDFTLKDTAGKTVSLSALRGKVVFLDFWASWCPPCRRSLPMVQQLHATFKDSKVVVLGINVENNAKLAAAFAKKEGLSYPILVGDGKVERAYRISGIPGFFIIDTGGRIVKKFEGFYPGMEKEWEKLIRQALNAKKPGGRP